MLINFKRGKKAQASKEQSPMGLEKRDSLGLVPVIKTASSNFFSEAVLLDNCEIKWAKWC